MFERASIAGRFKSEASSLHVPRGIKKFSFIKSLGSHGKLGSVALPEPQVYFFGLISKQFSRTPYSSKT